MLAVRRRRRRRGACHRLHTQLPRRVAGGGGSGGRRGAASLPPGGMGRAGAGDAALGWAALGRAAARAAPTPTTPAAAATGLKDDGAGGRRAAAAALTAPRTRGGVGSGVRRQLRLLPAHRRRCGGYVMRLRGGRPPQRALLTPLALRLAAAARTPSVSERAGEHTKRHLSVTARARRRLQSGDVEERGDEDVRDRYLARLPRRTVRVLGQWVLVRIRHRRPAHTHTHTPKSVAQLVLQTLCRMYPEAHRMLMPINKRRLTSLWCATSSRTCLANSVSCCSPVIQLCTRYTFISSTLYDAWTARV